jgi:hypothetical protein
MTKGKSIHFLRDDQPPATSTNTRIIAGALISGGTFASPKPFLDAIEDTPTGPKRQVTWCMDADKLMEFLPEFEAESINFGEFARRFLSAEWCEANPHHPISYMRAYSEQLNRLRDKLRTMKPMVLIRRGNKHVLIPADADAARREKILSHL